MSYLDNDRQALCSFQADLFVRSRELIPCGSSLFVSIFLNSHWASMMDQDTYSEETSQFDDSLGSLLVAYPSLRKRGGEKYQKAELEWMGYTYRAWSIIAGRKSKDLVRLIKPSKMRQLYLTFHTFGMDYCVERLEEMVSPFSKPKSELAVLKEVRSQH